MISNNEIINRFDVLYNNTMSNQAPSLDAYEMSVFFNKAQLEVLKNHLNPKGNKYGEGFDGSAKRQIDFSSLIHKETLWFPENIAQDGYNSNSTLLSNEVVGDTYNKVLSIVNESICVLKKSDYSLIFVYINDFVKFLTDFDSIPTIDSLTGLITFALPLNDNHPIKLKATELYDRVTEILFMPDNTNEQKQVKQKAWNDFIEELNRGLDIKSVIEFLGLSSLFINKVVVPINNVEYDTLMSRPYKFPPRSQAWRLIGNNASEFIIPLDEVPVQYRLRYVKIPAEVNLASDVSPEIPEALIDEVLQRAVELAKNAWEGNLETTKALGERSE